MSDKRQPKPDEATLLNFGGFAPAFEYMTDAAQRSLLFLDVMRQRGNALSRA